MYKEFNGREWSSEDQYLKFKHNVKMYMSRSLALEDYTDCSGDINYDNDIAFKMLSEYRKNNQNMTEQELLDTTALIVKKFDKLLDKVGREKFTFYEDGTLEYNWNK